MGKDFIPLSVPNLKGNEINYLVEAVKTEWVSTGGPYVDKFEREIASYTKSEGAVSCQNGTSGLHIALLVSGVTSEHIVLVPTLTFIAAVNPVSYVGAEPVFMDCDDSLCMDPRKVEKFCQEECTFKNEKLIDKKTGKHVKAIVLVHVFGNMADMEVFCEIAKKYHLKIIEDATEALGTYYTEGIYKGKFAGTIGDIGVYSFNGNKIITTGGGGMIVSDKKDYLTRARYLTTQAKNDELHYTHDEIGYNYRMTNLQAALGLGQLEQLEKFIEIKTRNYEIYQTGILNMRGLKLLPFRDGIRSNYWFYALYCDECYKRNRDQLIKHLEECGIQCRPIWGLIHEQKPYISSRSYLIERAKDYWKTVVNIPCSSNLSIENVATVLEALHG